MWKGREINNKEYILVKQYLAVRIRVWEFIGWLGASRAKSLFSQIDAVGDLEQEFLHDQHPVSHPLQRLLHLGRFLLSLLRPHPRNGDVIIQGSSQSLVLGCVNAVGKAATAGKNFAKSRACLLAEPLFILTRVWKYVGHASVRPNSRNLS